MMFHPLKYLMIGLAMLTAAALGVHFTPTKTTEGDSAPDFHKILPRQFGGWKEDTAIVPVMPTQNQQTNLNSIYSQIVSRAYRNRVGQLMMVVLAFGSSQSNRLKVHRQEVCYAAQGFKIEHLVHRDVAVDDLRIPITELYAVRGGRREAVTYWFTIGNHVALTRLGRLLTEIKYSATGQIPAGTLVRISSLGPGSSVEYRAQVRFADELLASIPPPYRHWLLGVGASHVERETRSTKPAIFQKIASLKLHSRALKIKTQ